MGFGLTHETECPSFWDTSPERVTLTVSLVRLILVSEGRGPARERSTMIPVLDSVELDMMRVLARLGALRLRAALAEAQ